MYFVRLQGCDVGCYFCDTKYTWKDKEPDVDEGEIIGRALVSGTKWMCITGGEPYEQPLSKLVNLASIQGLKTQVETSGGADWWDYHMDWITLSPKDLFTKERFRTKEEYKERSNEIKCVVTKPEDTGFYLGNYYEYCKRDKPLILQPVDNNTDLVQSILEEIEGREYARCMIQCHKIMAMR